MSVVLLIVHFLSLAVGIGGGVASAVMGETSQAADPAGKAALGKATSIVSNIGAVAIVLLWITGIWLVIARHGEFGNLPGYFWWKLIGVVILTLAIIGMHVVKHKAAGPPPPEMMKKLGQVALASATFTVIMAVIAFN